MNIRIPDHINGYFLYVLGTNWLLRRGYKACIFNMTQLSTFVNVAVVITMLSYLNNAA